MLAKTSSGCLHTGPAKFDICPVLFATLNAVKCKDHAGEGGGGGVE